jgi:hypothetical protein
MTAYVSKNNINHERISLGRETALLIPGIESVLDDMNKIVRIMAT